MAVGLSGDWEGWLKFFVRGVAETAEEATLTAGKIIELRERHRSVIQERGLGAKAFRAHDLLFEHPLVNVNFVQQRLGVSFATANKLVEGLEREAILEEVTGGRRNRFFRYASYLDLFAETPVERETELPVQTTESGPRRQERVTTTTSS